MLPSPQLCLLPLCLVWRTRTLFSLFLGSLIIHLRTPARSSKYPQELISEYSVCHLLPASTSRTLLVGSTIVYYLEFHDSFLSFPPASRHTSSSQSSFYRVNFPKHTCDPSTAVETFFLRSSFPDLVSHALHSLAASPSSHPSLPCYLHTFDLFLDFSSKCPMHAFPFPSLIFPVLKALFSGFVNLVPRPQEQLTCVSIITLLSLLSPCCHCIFTYLSTLSDEELLEFLCPLVTLSAPEALGRFEYHSRSAEFLPPRQVLPVSTPQDSCVSSLGSVRSPRQINGHSWIHTRLADYQHGSSKG